MNALKTHKRIIQEGADKAFQEKLEREKEEFELMSDEEKEEYLKIEAEKRKKLNAILSIPYLGISEFYK